MQRFDILPAKGTPSGCMLDDRAAAAPLIETFIASRGNSQIFSAPRQSRQIYEGSTTGTAEFLSLPAMQQCGCTGEDLTSPS
jgi:hypothetical protein